MTLAGHHHPYRCRRRPHSRGFRSEAGYTKCGSGGSPGPPLKSLSTPPDVRPRLGRRETLTSTRPSAAPASTGPHPQCHVTGTVFSPVPRYGRRWLDVRLAVTRVRAPGRRQPWLRWGRGPSGRMARGRLPQRPAGFQARPRRPGSAPAPYLSALRRTLSGPAKPDMASRSALSGPARWSALLRRPGRREGCGVGELLIFPERSRPRASLPLQGRDPRPSPPAWAASSG
ncbi:hypothetical protein J1605_021171 [Eschrichtius robustus]|uniref:Uncharacterized protein n=1 Tax=Eschrichtius robustus TaxID=9764 RepID=A0AB34HET0_ESCRO|nr:hypothetical protein J1605_021171 [Eschrichtius robustus]